MRQSHLQNHPCLRFVWLFTAGHGSSPKCGLYFLCGAFEENDFFPCLLAWRHSFNQGNSELPYDLGYSLDLLDCYRHLVKSVIPLYQLMQQAYHIPSWQGYKWDVGFSIITGT